MYSHSLGSKYKKWYSLERVSMHSDNSGVILKKKKKKKKFRVCKMRYSLERIKCKIPRFLRGHPASPLI